MRRLADALPTLREPAPAHASALPALIAPRGQEHGTRQSARPGSIPASGSQPRPREDAFDVASLRSALLKQRHTPAEAANPAASSASSAAPPTQSQARGQGQATVRPASPIPPLGEPAREKVEDRIKAAVAAERAEAEKDKVAAVELARKIEREVAARALATSRAAWAESEAAALAARFADAFEALHVRLSDAFGRVLAPIVEAAVREAAVRRFAETLDDLAGPAASAHVLTVKGPADLIDALARRMPGGGVTFAAAGAPELLAEVADTRLETTLAAFAATLAAAVLPTPPAPAQAAPAEPGPEPAHAPDEASDVR